jgi:hypothetical protein
MGSIMYLSILLSAAGFHGHRHFFRCQTGAHHLICYQTERMSPKKVVVMETNYFLLSGSQILIPHLGKIVDKLVIILYLPVGQIPPVSEIIGFKNVLRNACLAIVRT